MDARLMQARELHRDQRDRLIRELRAEGVPGSLIASVLGCSKELVSHVVKGRVGPGTRGRRPRDLT